MELNIKDVEKVFPTGSWYNLIVTEDKDLPDVIACYFSAGIQKHEKCVLYTDSIDIKSLFDGFFKLGVDMELVIKTGQLEIVKDVSESTDKGSCGENLIGMYDQYVQYGYKGLRIAADSGCNKIHTSMIEQRQYVSDKYAVSYANCCNADKMGGNSLFDIIDSISDFILVYGGKTYVHNTSRNFSCKDETQDRPVLLQMLIERQRLKMENNILELLNSISGEVTYNNDPEYILNIVLSKIMDTYMADMGVLEVQKNSIVRSQDNVTVICNASGKRCCLPDNISNETCDITETVLKSGQYISSETPGQTPYGLKLVMDKYEIAASVIVPVKLNEKIIGYLFLASKRKNYSFKGHIQFLMDSMKIVSSILYYQTQLLQIDSEVSETQKMKALGVLTSGIAHEFNNLLTPILGFAQIIRQKVDSQDLKMYVDMIENSAKDGAMIVKRVQEFTRRENKASRNKYDINEIITGVITMTQPRWKNEVQALGKKITIKSELNSCGFVLINPFEMREVITNIIFNSIDAIQNDGEIIIKSWDEGDEVFFSVEDNGIGMSEEVLYNIYTPFFTTKKERGTGLGMSIVYNILHNYGGAINVHSEIGKGSTIVMWLPAASQKDETLQSIDGVYDKFKGNVLVIDEQEAVRKTADSILTEFGFDADITSNGRQALNLYMAKKYKFVLCDLAMPDMTGIELAKRIKSIDNNAFVILMSGWVSDIPAEDRKHVDFLLNKPFTMHTMYIAVKEALSNLADSD